MPKDRATRPTNVIKAPPPTKVEQKKLDRVYADADRAMAELHRRGFPGA